MFANVMPWQMGAPIGLRGQYGQSGQYGQYGQPQQSTFGGQTSPQLNGGLGQQPGLLPLTAACLAAQTAFAAVLAQYGQALGAGWPGQQQYGQQQYGQQQYGPQQSIFGWPGQQQFGFGQLPIGAPGFSPQSGLGVPSGAFGQRGIGSQVPFQSAPQPSYAG